MLPFAIYFSPFGPVQYYFAAKVCLRACRMVSVIEALKAGSGPRQKAQVSLFA